MILKLYLITNIIIQKSSKAMITSTIVFGEGKQ